MQVDMRNCLKIFNSRPLVEVDLTKIANGALVDFQLTTSRGGRHITSLFTVINGSFSTHDLSWRSTAKLHNKSLKFCIFSGHFILEQMSLPFSYKYH